LLKRHSQQQWSSIKQTSSTGRSITLPCTFNLQCYPISTAAVTTHINSSCDNPH
jgi:hypothetical protein